MNYIDRLIKNCQAAKEAKPIQEFVVSDLSALDGIGKAIYIIEQATGEPEKTFAEFMLSISIQNGAILEASFQEKLSQFRLWNFNVASRTGRRYSLLDWFNFQ